MRDENNLLGLNDFWNLTKSQKLSRGAYIINMISEKIDNNQHIKRLMRYLTKDPLAKKSIDLNEKTIIQKDITTSLQEGYILKYASEEEKKVSFPRVLYKTSFNSNMKVVDQCYIFVENYRGIYKDNGMSTMYFAIHVIVPDDYNYICDTETNIGINRNMAIGCLIDNMLDDYTVDDKYTNLVGNITFKLMDFEQKRLGNNTRAIRLTLTYKTELCSERYLDDRYI